MAERIVSMHAAYKSGKEGPGHGFLNNPQTKSTVNREAAAKSVIKTSKWLRKYLA
jgi:hypothetical protein